MGRSFYNDLPFLYELMLRIVASSGCFPLRFPLLLFIMPFACMCLLYSCTHESKKTVFTLEEHTGIDFNNKVEDGKLENSFYFRNFYNGGGVAIGDINNDGYPDVFLTSNMG